MISSDMPLDAGHSQITELEDERGILLVEEIGDGKRRLRASPGPGISVTRAEHVTSYPLELIELVVRVRKTTWAIDEIAREEDSSYVSRALRYSLLGFVPAESFVGKRLLDFGSGSGASTVALARLFPDTEIVGVEVDEPLIELARARVRHFGIETVSFLGSPDPESLPADLGTFDFVNLGAVYEHLLPPERQRLLPQLWSVLSPGGVFFVNQLPHRFYPLEYHTTGLPLLNYLPDRLALVAARRFSSVADDATWEFLQRIGIRGGTASEVGADLIRGGGRARRLRPTQDDLRDHADLWYAVRSDVRPHPAKRAMREVFRTISRVVGEPFVPSLSLAYQKLV